MDEELMKQLFSELLDANEQAFAILAGAMGDVVGRAPLSKALDARLAKAQAAASHPTRDMLLATAAQVLKSK